MLAEIIGPDLIIILVVVGIVLIFGGSKLPKLARSLGSAQGEFKKGLQESHEAEATDAKAADAGTEAKAVEVKVVEAKPADAKAAEAKPADGTGSAAPGS